MASRPSPREVTWQSAPASSMRRGLALCKAYPVRRTEQDLGNLAMVACCERAAKAEALPSKA
jgi:hypothetical protein